MQRRRKKGHKNIVRGGRRIDLWGKGEKAV